MTGSDTYKEFDNASIITTSTGKDTISIGKATFRKRDVILGGIAVIALILVIIFAIVLAVEVGKKDDDDCKDSGSSSPGTSEHDLCITPACLHTSYYEKSAMNEDVKPCEDFYSFACGGYATANPQTYLLDDVTPANQVLLENTQQLVYMLDYPVEAPHENSYERKLKHFMSSCNNHFDRMDSRGNPLYTNVISQFQPDPYLLEDNFWDPTTFSLFDTLTKVHIDFWTASLFSVNVATDNYDWNKRVVVLDYGGIGMPYQYYPSDEQNSWIQQTYRGFIRQIATMFSYDAGKNPPNDTNIAQFVNDAFEVEQGIAMIIFNSPRKRDPHQVGNRTTLGQLTSLAQNQIDFTRYMKALFNSWPNLFTDSTEVIVNRENYFMHLGNLLNDYLTNDEDGHRKLHNYFMWQLMNRYSQDLSWEYVHAKRKLNNYMYGVKDDSSGYLYCFITAESVMSDAMSAVFLKHDPRQQDRTEGNNILNYVREELLKALDALQWMSRTEKDTAMTKIRNSLYKINYADYMVDDSYMDSLYASATITEDNFFVNILNLNKVSRQRYNDVIGTPNRRHLWAYHVFDPNVEYYNPWHELIATAAVFQYPIFQRGGPAYFKYGGVGSLIAKHLMHAVDEYGSQFRLDGSHYGSWWSDATIQRYLEVKNCSIQAQRESSLGTFTDPVSGVNISPNISGWAFGYAPELLADASGLRLAHRAYTAQQIHEGPEKMAPGFPGYSRDQMFFISFAQTFCQNTPDHIRAYQLTVNNRYPSKTKVNLAVGQVPEFAAAFKCRRGQPMVHPKTCTLL